MASNLPPDIREHHHSLYTRLLRELDSAFIIHMNCVCIGDTETVLLLALQFVLASSGNKCSQVETLT